MSNKTPRTPIISSVARLILARSAVGGVVGGLPGIADLFARLVWRGRMNTYFGVYPTWETATMAAQKFLPSTGWDDPKTAALLVDESPASQSGSTFQPAHYAEMFWLANSVREADRIIDLGGASGLSHEIYTRYRDLPAKVGWHVVDRPSVVARARKRHASTPDLSFGISLEDAGRCDILYAAGCLQYLPDPISAEVGVLVSLINKPRRIILNKVPLTDGEPFVTLQTLVLTAVPYHIFGRRKFLSYFEAAGYRLIDEWDVPELAVDLPFHPKRTIAALTGLCFDLIA